MVISYEPSWQMMKEKRISGYALVNQYGLCKSEVQRLRQDHNFNIFFIDHLCSIFDCDIEMIVVHIKSNSHKLQR